jgi:hypothetical protein
MSNNDNKNKPYLSAVANTDLPDPNKLEYKFVLTKEQADYLNNVLTLRQFILTDTLKAMMVLHGDNFPTKYKSMYDNLKDALKLNDEVIEFTL